MAEGFATDPSDGHVYFYKDKYYRTKTAPARRRSMRQKYAAEEIKSEYPNMRTVDDLKHQTIFRDRVEMVRGIVKEKVPTAHVRAHMDRGREQGVVTISPAAETSTTEFPELHEGSERMYTDAELNELHELGLEPASRSSEVKITPGEFTHYLTNWLDLKQTDTAPAEFFESIDARELDIPDTSDT